MSRRKQNPFKLAKLTDRKGDLSKPWFVRFSVLDPEGKWKEKMHRIPNYETKEERQRHAQGYIELINEALISGELNYYTVKWEGAPKEKTHSLKVIDRLDQAMEEIKLTLETKSYNSYNSAYRQFKQWLMSSPYKKIYLKQFKNEHAKEFLLSLQGQNKSNSTINKIKSFLSAIFFRIDEDNNPFSNLKGLKKEESKVDIWDPEDLKKYFNFLKEHDKAMHIISLLIFHGFVRPTEIIRIKKKDIDFKNGVIQIEVRKGKSKRMAPCTMSNELSKLLEDWLKDSTDEMYMIGKSFLPDNLPLSNNRIGDRFRKVKSELELNKPTCMLYELKHTGVSIMVEKGTPPLAIKDQCRHDKFETTEIYIKKLSKAGSKYFKDFPTI